MLTSSAPIGTPLLYRDHSRIPTSIGDTARNITEGMKTMPVFDWASYSGLPGVAISVVHTSIAWM